MPSNPSVLVGLALGILVLCAVGLLVYELPRTYRTLRTKVDEHRSTGIFAAVFWVVVVLPTVVFSLWVIGQIVSRHVVVIYYR